MSKMPCSISDGPQLPEDVPGYEEPDEDAEYEAYRQQEIDDEAHARRVDLAHAADQEPTLHTKIGKYSGTTLYSYDQAYWWSTEETALRMFNKLRGTNDA